MHRSVLRLCAVIALSLCVAGGANGQAPDPPVCNRTQQVQDAIVAAIDGISDCSDVTGDQLAAIAVLALSGQDITGLQSGDFSGLTNAILTLTIFDTQLQTLPADIFAGISPFVIGLTDNPFGDGLPSALIDDFKMRTEINLNIDLVFVQNTLPTTPLALTGGKSIDLDLEDAFFYSVDLNTRNPADSYDITVADNAVAEAEVNGHTLTITAVSGGQTDIVIVGEERSQGTVQSTVSQTLTVQVTDPAQDSPVCDRTQQVQDAIVAAIDGISDCNDVTSTRLATIVALDFKRSRHHRIAIG